MLRIRQILGRIADKGRTTTAQGENTEQTLYLPADRAMAQDWRTPTEGGRMPR